MFDVETLSLLDRSTPYLSLAHGVAFAGGIGAAVLTDVLALQILAGAISGRHAFRTLLTAHHVIVVALAAVWITGGMQVLRLALGQPDNWLNPKLLTKLVVVGMLTVNAWAIHRWCLPWIRTHIGNPRLASASLTTRVGLALSGGVSAGSWFYAFALGMLPIGRHNADVPALLVFYLVTVGAATMLAFVALTYLGGRTHQVS